MKTLLFAVLIFLTVRNTLVDSLQKESTNTEVLENTSRRKRHTESHSWNYGNEGPAVWADNFPSCSGQRQSPIDVRIENVEVETEMPYFEFGNYDVIFRDLPILNNGHTARISVPQIPEERVPYISGGGLSGRYNLIQCHFHWAQVDSQGSETLIDGFQFPLELHLVHQRAENVSSENDDNDVAVLAVLYELEDRPPTGSEKQRLSDEITDSIKSIQNPEAQSVVRTIRIADLLPSDNQTFFRYLGSMTNPPCSENVVWTVFPDTVAVSSKQLESFRQIRESADVILEKNFRPVQALNGRVVRFKARDLSAVLSTFSLVPYPDRSLGLADGGLARAIENIVQITRILREFAFGNIRNLLTKI